jgi:hypothetical protein
MIRSLFTALILAMPVAASAVPLKGNAPWDGRSRPRGEALLRSAMVAGHNEARRRSGAPPMIWDVALSRDAEIYAQTLARTNRFQHDRQQGRYPRQGENLFMGTRGAYSYSDMVRLWVEEGRQFRPGRFPNVSRTGSVWHVGHYTQIIWPTSRRFGCATASSRSNDYLVCRYFPAGNIVGTILR